LDPAGQLEGQPPTEEILWVKYFGIGGLGRSEALVNDRRNGFNEEYAAGWFPPNVASPAPLPVWGVVQDNRGGARVVRWDIVVTE
jgi:hypothetical protein